MAGGFYHVTSRAVADRMLFPDLGDREAFLRLFARVVADHRWLCQCYCLMGTHYHLMVQTPRADISVGMHRLNNGYAKSYNRRYTKAGHVFQARFGARLLEQEPHALEVMRYVALNPVRAGLCASPLDWRWSSYAALAGAEPAPPFLAVADALSWFDHDTEAARRSFRAFVEGALGEEP